MAEKRVTILVQAIDKASAVFGRIGGVVKGTFRSLATPLGATVGIGAMGMAFGKVIAAGAAFDKSMSRVKALTGETDIVMGQLREQAKLLGSETVFSASQAAEAMSQFALAGFKSSQIMHAMRPTLDLAAAGQIGIADAAGITARIMSGMGIPANEVAGAVDVMAKAFSTAQTDLTMLGEGLKFAGPIARSAGVSFGDTVAALQALSNAGIQAGEAGTALRNSLLKLVNPNANGRAELAKLGVTIIDQQGNLRNLADIVADFERGMGGLAGGEKLQSLGKIFGTKQAGGFAALLGQGSGELRRLQEALKDVDGTAARIAGVQLDNLAGDWIIFKSAMEGFAITVHEQLDGALRSAVQWGTGFANVMRRVTPVVGDVMRGLVDAVGPAVKTALGAVTSYYRTAFEINKYTMQALAGVARAAWAATGQAFASGIAAIKAAIAPVGALLDSVGVNMTSLKDTMIAGLLGIEYALVNWKTVAEISGLSVIRGIVVVGNTVRYWFTEVIPELIRWFADNWRNIFIDLGNWTYTVFTNLASNIYNVLSNLPSLIAGAVSFDDLWTPLTEGFKATLEELPYIAARVESPMEATLGRDIRMLQEKLGGGWEAFAVRRLGEMSSAAQAAAIAMDRSVNGTGSTFDLPALPAAGADSWQPGDGEDGNGFAGNAEGFRGRSVEGVKITQRFAGIKARFASGNESDPQRRIMDNTKAMADEQKKTTKAITDMGKVFENLLVGEESEVKIVRLPQGLA